VREAIARRPCSCGVEEAESVTPIEEAIHQEGHGVCRLQAVSVGIVPVTIVQQQDRAGRRALDRAACDLVGAGTIRIPHAQRPADRALAERAGDIGHPRAAKAVRRAKEARASARDYLRGAKDTTIRTFDFRDGFFPYHGMAIKEAFEGLKKEIEPDLIFTHCSHDRHQDHRLMCELTWNSFRGHLVLEYEIPKYDGDLSSPNCFIALDPKQAKRKAALLMRHFATQRNKHWFTEDLFLGLMRLRGIEANSGTPYAEGFYARKMVLL